MESEETDILKRIKKTIREREKAYKSTVTFTHIFSHIERKGDRVYKREIKQYNKFKKKIKRRKEKLGHLWKLAVWGNVKVDKAINKNPENMEIKNDPPEFKRKTGKIMIQNRKGETITNSLTHFLRRKREARYTKEIKKLPKRGATLKDTKTCQLTSNQYMMDKSWKKAQTNRHMWKARTHNLPIIIITNRRHVESP